MFPEDPRMSQHGVHQRSLAVVDVGYYSYVSNGFLHGPVYSLTAKNRKEKDEPHARPLGKTVHYHKFDYKLQDKCAGMSKTLRVRLVLIKFFLCLEAA